jgi:hypothetical protein
MAGSQRTGLSMKHKLITVFLIIFSSICLADESITNKIVGTWKLVSVKHIQILSGAIADDYGSHPRGYLNYSSDGQVMIMMIKSNRPKPKGKNISSAEAKALLDSMTSYAGTYEIKDNKIIHHVDISWNEAWSGTDQIRYYKMKGNRLTLFMAPFDDPKYGKISVQLVWEKVFSYNVVV